MTKKTKDTKKIVALAALATTATLTVVPSGVAEAQEMPMEASKMDQSKWSTVSYSKDTSKRIKSEQIVINNIYTQPSEWYSHSEMSNETTGLEAIQTWEAFLQKQDSSQKIVGSDLDPSNPIFKDIFGWDSARLHSETIQSSFIDTYTALTNSYMSRLTDSNQTVFANRNNFTDKVYAQLKAAKMRADVSKNELIKLGQYSEDMKSKYEKLSNYFEQITHYYNNAGSTSYRPIINKDPDTNMSISDMQRIDESFGKYPQEIREMFSKIVIVGKGNLKNKGIEYYLGYATNDRAIHLNGVEKSDYVHTLAHEVAHTIDFMGSRYNTSTGELAKRLSDTTEFKKVHQSSYSLLRDYYKDTTVEGFAEGFGRWLLWKYQGYSADEAFGDLGEDARIYFDVLGNQLFGDDVAPRTYKPDKSVSTGYKNFPTPKRDSVEPVKVATTEASPSKSLTHNDNSEVTKQNDYRVVTGNNIETQEEKPVVKETKAEIPSRVIYREDKTLEGGQVRIERGKSGVELITITSTKSNVATTRKTITPAEPTYIYIGTKSKSKRVLITPRIVFRAAPHPALRGYTVEGSSGERVATTTYKWKQGQSKTIARTTWKTIKSPKSTIVFY